MSTTETIHEVGSKIGMELRSGQVTAVGCTERIRHLNEMLHQARPNLDHAGSRCENTAANKRNTRQLK